MKENNTSSKRKKIKLDIINTEVAARNFSELFKINKTYFLDAKWGSGKTDFLNKVEKYTNKKYVILDLWRVRDERNVVTIAFSKLRPLLYWSLYTSLILAVIISILMTDVVNLGLSKHIDTIGMQRAGLIALLIAVLSFFKIKNDVFYIVLLKLIPFKKKILIIDDFDRIDVRRQEDIYKLFNLIEGRIPILFLGDYSKIPENDDYLKKIINKKMSLPFDVHPKKIWTDYFKKLEKTLSIILPNSLKKVIISEGRNLRDRYHFNEYVNHEFFIRGKLNHVQPIEQLLVIYVYLFHPEYYSNLMDNITIEPGEPGEEDIENLLFAMQTSNSVVYPCSFRKNDKEYFLYEQPSNMTVERLKEITENKEDLNTYLLSNISTDFYQYLQAEYDKFDDEKKEKILIRALSLIKQNLESDSIRLVISSKNNEICLLMRYVNNDIYRYWYNILIENEFDISQILYFFRKNRIYNYSELGELSIDDIELSDLTSVEHIYHLLNVYLSAHGIWNEFEEWPNEIWDAFPEFTNEQYILFWLTHGVLESHSDREYTLWLIKKDSTHLIEDKDYRDVVKKMTPRLNELRKIGYIFNEKNLGVRE